MPPIIEPRTLAPSIGDCTTIQLGASCLGRNRGPAGFAAVVKQFSNGEVVQTVLAGTEVESTGIRAEMKAAILGLESDPVPRPHVTWVICPVEFIVVSVQRDLAEWSQSDWTRLNGEPLKNVELWQSLHSLMQARDVRWIVGARDEYAKRQAHVALESLRQSVGTSQGRAA